MNRNENEAKAAKLVRGLEKAVKQAVVRHETTERLAKNERATKNVALVPKMDVIDH